MPNETKDTVKVSDINSIITEMIRARNKYYSGYVVESTVVQGEVANANKINSIATQCLAITNKSPLKFTYGSVVAGELLKKPLLTSMLRNITEVANCYTNCHSNCHSNCRCTCTGTNGCGDK